MSLIEKLSDLNAVKGGFGERLAAYYSKTVFSDAMFCMMCLSTEKTSINPR